MSGRYADLHTAPVFCHRVNEQCSIHVMITVFASGAERKHFFMYVLPNFLIEVYYIIIQSKNIVIIIILATETHLTVRMRRRHNISILS